VSAPRLPLASLCVHPSWRRVCDFAVRPRVRHSVSIRAAYNYFSSSEIDARMNCFPTESASRDAQTCALARVFSMLDGMNWIHSDNWLVSNGAVDAVCGWHGVTCLGGQVVSLRLPANMLRGFCSLTLLVGLDHLRCVRCASRCHGPPALLTSPMCLWVQGTRLLRKLAV
jgi:hypothetical protein